MYPVYSKSPVYLQVSNHVPEGTAMGGVGTQGTVPAAVVALQRTPEDTEAPVLLACSLKQRCPCHTMPTLITTSGITQRRTPSCPTAPSPRSAPRTPPAMPCALRSRQCEYSNTQLFI